MHRKGLGEKLMSTLLFQAKGQGFGYVTLQASQPGRGLYLKLGFKEQFVLKNYALQKQS
jgi:ribosomal protein S18 acetylase RimI-like enzyme